MHYRRWRLYGDSSIRLLLKHNHESENKTCPTCRIEQSKSNFYPSKNNNDGLRGQCQSCEQLYIETHIEAHKIYHTNWKLLDRYGITLTEWEDLFLSQDQRCAICKSFSHNGINWHTDHCHSTNTVRGILCFDCNIVVGKIENGWGVEVPAITRYLEEYNALVYSKQRR